MAQLLEVVGPRSGSAPLVYTVVEEGTFDLQSVFAHFDGAGASGDYRPVVTIKAQNGTILGRVFPDQQLAAGDDADVTYIPFRRATATVAPAGSYEQTILATPTLLAYWPMNDPALPVIDISGNGHHFTAGVGTPAYQQPGPLVGTAFPYSMTFSGTRAGVIGGADQFIYRDTGVAAWGLAGDFTIEALVKVGALAAAVPAGIFEKYGPVASGEVILGVNGGGGFGGPNNVWVMRANESIFPAEQLTAVWIQVTTTYDGTDCRIYYNGALVESAASTPGVVSPNVTRIQAGQSYFQASGSEISFRGGLAHMSVYTSALSAATVAEHAAAAGL